VSFRGGPRSDISTADSTFDNSMSVKRPPDVVGLSSDIELERLHDVGVGLFIVFWLGRTSPRRTH